MRSEEGGDLRCNCRSWVPDLCLSPLHFTACTSWHAAPSSLTQPLLWLSNQGASYPATTLAPPERASPGGGPGADVLIAPWSFPKICAQPSYHFGHISLILRDSGAFWKAQKCDSNFEASFPAPRPHCFAPTLSKPSSISYPCSPRPQAPQSPSSPGRLPLAFPPGPSTR